MYKAQDFTEMPDWQLTAIETAFELFPSPAVVRLEINYLQCSGMLEFKQALQLWVHKEAVLSETAAVEGPGPVVCSRVLPSAAVYGARQCVIVREAARGAGDGC